MAAASLGHRAGAEAHPGAPASCPRLEDVCGLAGDRDACGLAGDRSACGLAGGFPSKVVAGRTFSTTSQE